MVPLKDKEGKSRIDLIVPDFILEIGQVLRMGAEKYEENSWQGIATDDHYAACLRHLLSWKKGELLDKESGMEHLIHAATNIMFMHYTNKNKDILTINNNKMTNNVYNKTDLDPVTSFERHIFHRDQFAHYLRWSFVLKQLRLCRNEQSVVDFGCGKGNLFEVFYRNKYAPKFYTGLDIRGKTIEKNKEKFKTVGEKCHFIEEDLITLSKGTDLKSFQADVVTSFEVIEHVGKKNGSIFLQNMKQCGNENAIYYISTPVFDPTVGAAGNHTYPDFKGGEPVPQEFTFEELKTLIEENGFEIINTIGMFASQKDYKPTLTESQKETFQRVSEVFDTNMVSVIMAGIVPAEFSRNVLWILKAKN